MEHDVVVVGASLAGSTTAMLLARQGARVALVEQRPDPSAYKRVCGHFIQASAVPALERSGLLAPMLAAGAVRSHSRLRTPWGWTALPEEPGIEACVNLRREKLDPLVRATAAATPGVDLLLGRTVVDVLRRDDGRVAGVVAQARDGQRTALAARLVVGADGRDSRVAALAGLPERRWPHARFSYGAYYEGPPPAHAPDGTLWLLDPDWAAAFPTDDGLTLYAYMAPKERAAEVKGDLVGHLERFVSGLPDAPPILESRRVSQVFGKVEMPNVARGPVAPGLALVGDAALATDPLWGVGCGWAFQTAEWLAERAAPALGRGERALDRALAGYARTHKRRIGPHARAIHGYAGGRRFSRGEQMFFRAATLDPKLAVVSAAFGTRSISPTRMLLRGLPRAIRATAGRQATSRANSRSSSAAGSSVSPV
jgi:flavin-dependent dehydrogenase